MKIYKIKLIVAVLTFSLSILCIWSLGDFSFISSTLKYNADVSEVSDQALNTSNRILPVSSNSNSKIEPNDIPKLEYPFKDYPVTEIYKGKNAPLRLKSDDLDWEKLQYTIENSDVNFAGHYISANWSCGMWCSSNYIIDAKTGRIYGWDGMLSVCFPDIDTDFDCNENFSNVENRIDSKLIIFFGYNNGESGTRGFHYYKFENGRLIHLKSILVKEQRSQSEFLLDRAGKKTDSHEHSPKNTN